MKAYKCDRCGKLFERYDGQGTPKFFNILCIPTAINTMLDLCPDCNSELQKWVADGKKQAQSEESEGKE